MAKVIKVRSPYSASLPLSPVQRAIPHLVTGKYGDHIEHRVYMISLLNICDQLVISDLLREHFDHLVYLNNMIHVMGKVLDDRLDGLHEANDWLKEDLLPRMYKAAQKNDFTLGLYEEDVVALKKLILSLIPIFEQMQISFLLQCERKVDVWLDNYRRSGGSSVGGVGGKNGRRSSSNRKAIS